MQGFSPGLAGADLAAGAMSRAIGDIFRGQVEAQQQVPAIQANAEAIEGSRQQRQTQMMKLPAELARERQGLQLGEWKIKAAPLEYQNLRDDVRWQEVERGWKSADRSQLDKARRSATELANELITAPTTDPTLRNFLSAIRDNPDAVMTHFGKMAEQQNHFTIQSELEKLKAKLHPKTMEQLATEGMTAEDARKFWERQHIGLREDMNRIRDDLNKGHITLYQAISEMERAKAEWYRTKATAEPAEKESVSDKQKRAEIARRQVQLRGERAVMEQRVSIGAKEGKPDLESARRLNEIIAEERSLMTQMPGAAGPTPGISWRNLPGVPK